jgi:ribonuclease VapC
VLLLDELLSLPLIEQVPPSSAESQIAYHGFVRFGKGRHPAALNFGDLFAYALAKSRSLPLLFKGDDFTQSDLERAS